MADWHTNTFGPTLAIVLAQGHQHKAEQGRFWKEGGLEEWAGGGQASGRASPGRGEAKAVTGSPGSHRCWQDNGAGGTYCCPPQHPRGSWSPTDSSAGLCVGPETEKDGNPLPVFLPVPCMTILGSCFGGYNGYHLEEIRFPQVNCVASVGLRICLVNIPKN